MKSVFLKSYSSYFNLFILIGLMHLVPSSLYGQGNNPSPLHFPTPKRTDNMLFYLQRDPNTNTLIYKLNLDENGNLIKSAPVLIQWIRYAEKGEIKGLSYIQRKFAYGLETKEIAKDKYEIRFISYKKLPLYLYKNKDNEYQVSVNINAKTIKINRIFVRIEGGSFWIPNVKYAEVEGIDDLSGKSINERISIK